MKKLVLLLVSLFAVSCLLFSCVSNNEKTFSIDVVSENGQVSGLKDKYVLGEEVTLTATPNDGYKFIGWEINEELILDNPISFYAHENQSVVANFLISTQYGVVLHFGDSTIMWGSVDDESKAMLFNLLVEDEPEKEGHDFLGWFVGGEDNPSEYSVPFTGEYNIEDTLHLWAYFEAWKYEITWLDATGGLLGTTTVDYGKIPEYTLPLDTAEWDYTGWTPELLPASKETTYTAVRTKQKYTVSWIIDSVVVESDINIEYGTIPTFNGSTFREGYTFLGWSLTSDGNVLSNIPSVSENIAYYAIYRQDIIIYHTLSIYYDNILYLTDEIADGSSYTLPNIDLKDTRKTFEGYAKTYNGIVTYSGNQRITITNDIDLYIIYSSQGIVVTVHTNIIDQSPSSIYRDFSIELDEPRTLSENDFDIPSILLDSYGLIGLYTNSGLTIEFDMDNIVSESLSLWIEWGIYDGVAVEKNLTINQSNLTPGSYTDGVVRTIDSINFTYNQIMSASSPNSGSLQLKAGAGMIYNTTSFGRIISISITQTGTNRTGTMYFGLSQNPTTNSKSFSSTTTTYDVSDYDYSYFSYKNTSGNAQYIVSIIINYEFGTSELIIPEIKPTIIYLGNIYESNEAIPNILSNIELGNIPLLFAKITWESSNQTYLEIIGSNAIYHVPNSDITVELYAYININGILSAYMFELTLGTYIQSSSFPYDDINSIYGINIKNTYPEIHTNDCELDNSSTPSEIDVWVWIYDWNESDVAQYIADLAGMGFIEEDNGYKHELYNFTIYIEYDAKGSCWYLYEERIIETGYERATNFAPDLTANERLNLGDTGLPNSGSYQVPVVFIDFNDKRFINGQIDRMMLAFNGTPQETGWHSVSSFYTASSFGKLNLEFVNIGTFNSPNSYRMYETSTGDQDVIELALNSLNSGPNNVDFSQYDYNNDGAIDSIYFVYSVDLNYDVDPWWAWVYSFDSNDHNPANGYPSSRKILDSKNFVRYAWFSVNTCDRDGNTFMNESSRTVYTDTMIHETGHLLGLTDYYNNENEGSIGNFDMMGENMGEHGPFNKLSLGWIKPYIAKPGTITMNLGSYSETGEAILIPYNVESGETWNGISFSEYLLVIYYRNTGPYQAFDAAPNNNGIIIYHVDARITSSYSFWWCDLWENGMTDNKNDKQLIRILEADKNNSIFTSGISNGDILTSVINPLNLNTYYWNTGYNNSIDVIIQLNSLGSDNANVTITI